MNALIAQQGSFKIAMLRRSARAVWLERINHPQIEAHATYAALASIVKLRQLRVYLAMRELSHLLTVANASDVVRVCILALRQQHAPTALPVDTAGRALRRARHAAWASTRARLVR